MTKEELEKEAEELIQRFEMANSMNCFMQLTPDRKQMGEMLVMIAEPREKRIAELELKIKHITKHLELQTMTALFKQVEEEVKQEQRLNELEAQIEKLTDFVLSKTECCDVCPITDTCINSEGVCPYAGILAKGEEEVTRKWLMQFIAKEIKEND